MDRTSELRKPSAERTLAPRPSDVRSAEKRRRRERRSSDPGVVRHGAPSLEISRARVLCTRTLVGRPNGNRLHRSRPARSARDAGARTRAVPAELAVARAARLLCPRGRVIRFRTSRSGPSPSDVRTRAVGDRRSISERCPTSCRHPCGRNARRRCSDVRTLASIAYRRVRSSERDAVAPPTDPDHPSDVRRVLTMKRPVRHRGSSDVRTPAAARPLPFVVAGSVQGLFVRRGTSVAVCGAIAPVHCPRARRSRNGFGGERQRRAVAGHGLRRPDRRVQLARYLKGPGPAPIAGKRSGGSTFGTRERAAPNDERRHRTSEVVHAAHERITAGGVSSDVRCRWGRLGTMMSPPALSDRVRLEPCVDVGRSMCRRGEDGRAGNAMKRRCAMAGTARRPDAVGRPNPIGAGCRSVRRMCEPRAGGATW